MDKLEPKKCGLPHHIILQDRKRLESTGVSDVDNFDDSVVVAYTAQDALVVRGTNLHITKLNLENGDLALEGQVVSISYEDAPKRGFFGRLFR